MALAKRYWMLPGFCGLSLNWEGWRRWDVGDVRCDSRAIRHAVQGYLCRVDSDGRGGNVFPVGSGSTIFQHRPQIRQGYPLNLSISISGGKETNQDSPSNGE